MHGYGLVMRFQNANIINTTPEIITFHTTMLRPEKLKAHGDMISHVPSTISAQKFQDIFIFIS